MWVDKYRPRCLKNVIGQQGDKSSARKLLRCLFYLVCPVFYLFVLWLNSASTCLLVCYTIYGFRGFW